MAKRTVTVCDICGAILGDDACRIGPVVVGHSFDGHRNDEDTATVDLCPEHYRAVASLVDSVTGRDAHDTTRLFNRAQAEAVVLLVVCRWGKLLKSIQDAGVPA